MSILICSRRKIQCVLQNILVAYIIGCHQSQHASRITVCIINVSPKRLAKKDEPAWPEEILIRGISPPLLVRTIERCRRAGLEIRFHTDRGNLVFGEGDRGKVETMTGMLPQTHARLSNGVCPHLSSRMAFVVITH